MTSVLPKLRSDLIVVRHATHAGTTYVLKDPSTGAFFRLGEVERFIVERCDGVSPVDGVRRGAEEQFDALLPPESLERFLATLEGAGLLDRGQGGPRAPVRRRRYRGNPLYFRVPICDPDRFLGRLAGRIGFLFTPGFAAVSLVLILLAAAIAVSDWGDIREDVVRLYRLSAIPWIWLTVWSVVAAHELAHGLACKRLGGEVHELGFMMIYLQPAAYCNVSDAWLFPHKTKRLLVTLAGPYFELCLWALSTLVWRVTDVTSPIHAGALIVVATSGIKTIFNLNPLLKLDGYYLLSDFLEVPNLRRRAFRLIGERLGALVGRDTPIAAGMSPRERRICLAYGLLATLFSFAFLGFALARLGRYVFRDQTLAFALGLGLLSVKLPRRLGRLFPGAGGDAGDDDDDWGAEGPIDSPDGAQRKQDSGTPPEPGAKAAGRPGFGRKLALIAAAGAALAILCFTRAELKIRGPFSAQPRHNTDVRAQVDGIIEAVCVEEGDHVRAGALIARLSSADQQAELGKIEAQLEQSRAHLRMLEAGPTKEDIAVVQAAVTTAEGHLPYARDRLAMKQQLFKWGIVSKTELELAEEDAVTAEHEVAEAKSKLEALLSGARPEEIEATRAEIKGLEVQRRLLDEHLRQMEVRSPASGIIATPAVQLHDLTRRHVQPGDLIAEVHDDSVITALIAVPEQDIADVKVGQPILLKARALPELTFHGTVAAVAPTAQGSSGSGASAEAASDSKPATSVNATPKTVLVTTRIPNPALLLKPEMTGQAKVLCGPRPLLALATRGLARMLKVEFWSWS